MKLSIVSNAYNQGKFLKYCLDSVLSQNYPDLEMIVVDPFSTDETPDILSDYKTRYPDVLTIIREKDKGPADGLNKGFALATGDWYSYINADDYYLPGSFAHVSRAVQAHPQAGAIQGYGYLADTHGRLMWRVMVPAVTRQRIYYGQELPIQQATFYRREAYQAVGGFNAANQGTWDGEIMLDITLKGYETVLIPEFLGVFVLYGESITGSGRLRELCAREEIRQFTKLAGHPPSAFHQKVVVNAARVLNKLADPALALAKISDRMLYRAGRAPVIRP